MLNTRYGENGARNSAFGSHQVDTVARLRLFERIVYLLLFPVLFLSTLTLPGVTPLAQAAESPDAVAAREIQRQQERERALREQQERQPDVRLLAPERDGEPPLAENETPCFTIREILLDSDTPAFDWARQAADRPDPATGRCLGSKGINQVMARIQNAIIERGYVTTRVLAEAQDLTSGTLKLKIIPGRIRSIRFSPESDSRANAWTAFPAAPGDLLNLRDIEQALENWKRVPTAEADIQIAPGEVSGESDLIIAWKQAFPLRFSLSANNGGSRSTGKISVP
jgi:hemolysin activation/secretion protein